METKDQIKARLLQGKEAEIAEMYATLPLPHIAAMAAEVGMERVNAHNRALRDLAELAEQEFRAAYGRESNVLDWMSGVYKDE